MDKILHDLSKIAKAQREYLRIQKEIAEAQSHMVMALDKLYNDLMVIHGGKYGNKPQSSDTGVRSGVGDVNGGPNGSPAH